MAVKHHISQYELGHGELRPDQRIIVSTRPGPGEPQRVARHLGVSELQPEGIIRHHEWDDGHYMPEFLTKQALDDSEAFQNYVDNYTGKDGPVFGQGLKGRTVYIVHTPSRNLTLADLNTRILDIAEAAKYSGAENVVLLAYTLDHDAQERGIHDTDHPRMQTEKSKKGYDGQAKLLEARFKHYLNAGIDRVIVPHIHSQEEAMSAIDDLNTEFIPMQQQSARINSTQRYKLDLFPVDMAPVVALLLSQYGESHLGFDLSDSGRNVMVVGPDAGIIDFVKRVHKYSGLKNLARAVMNKEKSEDGSEVERLVLQEVVGLDGRSLDDMYILVMDDKIRSGKSMRFNLEVLCGGEHEGIIRDPRIQGRPKRVAVYSTRTNFAGNSIDILSSNVIHDIFITNADPRGFKECGKLAEKLQYIYANFLMAEAARAVEMGVDSNTILTPEFIRERNLLKIVKHHEHRGLEIRDHRPF